ncbi:MAG: hypothetical protein AAF721_03800 [Myxococcota bacterium]
MTTLFVAQIVSAGPAIEVSVESQRVVAKVQDGKIEREVLRSRRFGKGVALPWLGKAGGKGAAFNPPAVTESAKTKLSDGLLLRVGCDGVATDGTKTWKLPPRASLLLPDGTKITFAGTSTNRCRSIDVMSGDRHVHLAGIDGKLRVGKTRKDRWAIDAKVADGTVFIVGADGERYRDWATVTVRKGRIEHGDAIVLDAGDGVSRDSAARAWQLTPAMLDALVGRGGGFSSVRAGPFGALVPRAGLVLTKSSPIVPDNGQGKVSWVVPDNGQAKVAAVVPDNGSAKVQGIVPDNGQAGALSGVLADRGAATLARSIARAR